MNGFFYLNKKDRLFIITTNLKTVSEFSVVSYSRVYNWFRNGVSFYEDSLHLCVKSNIVKGKQRVNGKPKHISNMEIIEDKKKEFIDLFDTLHQ
jgi:hypothetical protein